MASTESIQTQPTEHTAEDVALHKSPSDNWMIIHGEVFDVTQYLEDHPGGAELLVEAAGTDATKAFDNAGHSEDALEIMREFRVGVLKGYKKLAPKRSAQAPRVIGPAPKPRPSSTGTSMAVATGLAAALSAAAYYSRHGRGVTVPTGLVDTSRLPQLAITGGFAAGFVAASALAALLTTAAAAQLSTITHIPSGFIRFPAHKPSTKPRTAKRASPPATGFLNPKTYQSLPLIRRDELAPGVLRLVFALPTATTILGLPTGQHIAIRAAIDGKTVTRSYTPVSNNSDRGVLELVIRCYPDGLLTSRYLGQLRPGIDSVELRGPKGAMRYRRGWAKKIGMVAGGTGITPMYQVIRAICEDPLDQTEVSLVYASRGEGDILLRRELEALAERHPSKLWIWYLLDVAPAGWAYGVGYATREVLQERMPPPSEGSSKLMLCGPPGMVNAVKGALVEIGFKAPGAAASMEDDIFIF